MRARSFKASISGVRGIVGKDINPIVAMNFAFAYTNSYLKKDNATIALAYDGRKSGLMLKYSLISALISSNTNIIDLGIVPTPTLLFTVREKRLDGGIIITASHNPIEWNGFKFADNKGLLFNSTKFDELMMEYYKSPCSSFYSSCNAKSISKGSIAEDKSAFWDHIEKALSLCDIALIQKQNFKVALDTVNSSGTNVIRKLLESKLQCIVYPIHDDLNKDFERQAEPLAENIAGLEAFVLEKGCDIGFATDPDADRLAIVSEKGLAIGEEYTLLIAVDNYITNKEKTDIALNISTSRMSSDIALKYNTNVYRSSVGETNVLQTMLDNDCKIGGEGNGGVIIPSINACRDSLVAIIMTLDMLAKKNISVSKLISTYPIYFFLKDKINIDKAIDLTFLYKKLEKLYKDKAQSISFIDGIRVDLDDYWFQIRKSNTEPIIRVFVEANNKSLAMDTLSYLKETVLGAI